MAHTLKERLSLRQLRKALNTKLFGHQNNKMANALDISPAWIHQSRLNYRYIFNRLDAFWPDWAIEQFSPLLTTTQSPNNELLCLNTSTRECFSFFSTKNASHQLDINCRGFISFPFLHWGISLQTLENNEFRPFFQSDLSLNRHQPIIQYSHQDDQKLTSTFQLSFDQENALAHIEISYKNSSDTPIDKSLNLGIVPYTNEGVGGIRSIQYCSNNQMVINDSSIVSVSTPPQNIVCTNFSQGNIFNCSKKWDMILSSQCDDFLASGLFNFQLKLEPRKKLSFNITIQHSDPFITPMSYPLSKINHFFLSKSPQFMQPQLPDLSGSTLLRINKTPSLYQITPLVIQYFLLTIQYNSSIYTTEILYYTLHSLMQLQATEQIGQLISKYHQSPKRFSNLSYLTHSQTLLFNHVLVIDIIHQFRFNLPNVTGPLIIKAQQLIAKDPFCSFIKKLSIKKFKSHIKSTKYLQFFVKLIVFLFITKKLDQRKIATAQSKECRSICADYLKIIFNNDTLLQRFINDFSTTDTIQLSDKLFLCHSVFRFILPTDMQQKIIDSISLMYWKDHQLLNRHHFEGHSDKCDLIFSHISSPNINHTIMSNYIENTNSFGQYFNQKSQPLSFQSYPSKLKSHHALFIHSFFNLIAYDKDRSLHIPALLHFSHLDIAQLNTPFGRLSIAYSRKTDNDVAVQITHEFKTSPKSITLYCTQSYTNYSFSTKKSSLRAIEDHQVIVPLNEHMIYLS
ncbi:hypothetical protein DID73_01890 [Candidatus Marinamargulisbacteria bacterium SCGC AG-343-K17]|nr:hypothetical protein DID73_01890 [Candidatus Marinamargulisbacteria bacterium SCGC AG-343-K17]